MESDMHEIDIRDGTQADINSLTTIIPRSFVRNARINKLFPPDSPAIRQWWAEVYKKAIDSSFFHILVAVTKDQVVGLLTLHLWRADQGIPIGPGICALVPLTSDHDPALIEALHNQGQERAQKMNQQPNFLIDLMAVDRDYQNKGIGKRLLRYACSIADEQRVAIFLQTSAARRYYLSLGLGFESNEGDESGTVTRQVFS